MLVCGVFAWMMVDAMPTKVAIRSGSVLSSMNGNIIIPPRLCPTQFTRVCPVSRST